jgi:hypothetical protein
MTCDPWVTPDPRPVSTVQKMPHIVRAFFADPDLRYTPHDQSPLTNELFILIVSSTFAAT